ncbi:PAP2 superfamily protein [Haladaptatus litoreus]|uniref:PAP2 superfamily protein n=1 Tax=Haladaptatus litoreus TaxID=553468 RepID=A0A1N7CZM5_9EURY|nr:phosphatase PAP2 family protein [Haladaptatus litoreus]SIR69043.1 PAP2 superfamily protein [Haladaptatus litoreus]
MNIFIVGYGIILPGLLGSQAPWVVILLFALITQLGDVWFLFLLSGVLYVGGEYVPYMGIDRRRGVFIIGLVLTYVALIGVLKSVLLLPRPPGATDPPPLRWIPSIFADLFIIITTAKGPGFPSGHALGATMVWGGLALVIDRGSYRVRFGIAGVVVTLVSLSRLVLGVHYFVDVLAGIILGIVVLGILYWLAENETHPERVLLTAVVIGSVGLFVNLTFESVVAIGGAVGGWIVWRTAAEAIPNQPSTRREVIVALFVGVIATGIFGAVYILDVPYLFTFLGTAIAVGTAVGAPIISKWLS